MNIRLAERGVRKNALRGGWFPTTQKTKGGMEVAKHSTPEKKLNKGFLIFPILSQVFLELGLNEVDLAAKPHSWFSSECIRRGSQYVALPPIPDDKPHGTTKSSKHTLDKQRGIVGAGRVKTDLSVAELLEESPTWKLATGIILNSRLLESELH